jgi:hypothetical protein
MASAKLGRARFLLQSLGILPSSTLMQTPVRWPLLLVTSLLLAGAHANPKPTAEDIEHIREELGVNGFTAPSIEVIFQELDALKPIPFDKAWRDLPEAMPQDRAKLALTTGAVIADGFLAVAGEKQTRIEQVGRTLLKLAKGLGVGDRVSQHSRSILEKALRQQWADIKAELVRTQAEVETAMMGLKDEEIAHLIALGGWLRALEIAGTVTLEDYTPERARGLIQPELLDYFLDRVSTLNPNIKKTKLGQTLEKNLQEIKRITATQADGSVSEDGVKQIRDLARDLNKRIGGSGE